VADRHLREVHVARELGDAPLMLRIAVSVHEYDRHRLNAVGHGALELGAHRGKVQLALDRAVGADTLVDLEHLLEQHFRLDDVLGENLRPRLVADAQRVAETLGGEKKRAVALALQQRIGRDRGAHLHRADPASGDWLASCKAEEIADALDGGVAVGLGVLGEELVGLKRAVRPPSHHVGEGAAAIDPEVPLSLLGFRLLHASVKRHHCC
jgi:hypothetical protein